jgi:hypothetical protein
MYKPVDFDDYSLRLEVGVVPSDDTSLFLSKLSVAGGTISQVEYEKFLVTSLVKNSTQFKAVLDKLNKRDHDIFRGQLIETVYKLNNKLRPQYLVIVGEKVMDQSDALRKNLPVIVTLPANPGWITSVEFNALFNPVPAQSVVSQAWEEIKRKYPERDYIKKHINSLNLEVPILQIDSVNVTPDRVVQDYVERRCENDVEMAKATIAQWKAHVIAATVPKIQELFTALSEGNYINIYTETIVMTQLYLAVVDVNPSLDWGLIDWSLFEDRRGDYGAKILKGKKLPGRGRPLGRSSRDEVEAEKKRFNTLSAQTILELKDRIKGVRIVGQDHAIDAVVDAIAVARVGLRGEEKPVGSWLLPGPTGVGKTEFAKVLADELGVELVRVDCSEYQHAHEISKLFGAPPGYVGFEDSRQDSGPPMTLAAKVKANPFCVVLFDELEKADKAIFNVLLQIMDDGVVTSGRGESIRFNESVILMTSNVGTKEAAEICNRNPIGIRMEGLCDDKTKLEAEAISSTIKELFSPEFLNRLTGIIQFNRLDKIVCRDITDVMLAKTKINLEKAQHMTMSWDDSVKDYLLEEGYSEEYGARNIGRAVQKNLELPLAEWILRNKYIMSDDGDKENRPDLIKIRVKDGEFIFKEGKSNNGTKKNSTNEEGIHDTGHPSKRRRGPRSNKTPDN